MSNRNVAYEILSVVVLANAGQPLDSPKRITVDEVRQFIAGSQTAVGEASTELTFPVAPSECVVVVSIEQFNADVTDPLRPRKVTIGSEGVGATRAEVPADWAMGQDVFYVFGPGTAKFTFQASPEAGASLFARVTGYFLPVRVLDRLSRVGTRVISISNL